MPETESPAIGRELGDRRQWLKYDRVHRAEDDPAAVRAVGTANGANPVAVIVPCHRVIGSNGKLTGYGGGLDRKQWLLEHEGVGNIYG